MKSDPALDFILAQTKQNIQFLVSQGALDKEDGAVILGKLDLSASDRPSLQTADSAVQRINTPVHKPPSYSEKIPSSPETCISALSSGTPLFTVRALWGYNEDGKDEKDLSFRSGDIIEVLAETNTDWWLGKLHGREGLLPSTYVERLSAAAPPRPTSTGMTMLPASPFYQGERPLSFPTPGGSSYPGGPPYPQGAPYYPPAQGYSILPPPRFGYAPPQQSPPPGASVTQGVGQQGEQPQKHKFGKLGNTLAHSAVGGVGFGAGSAVGSGIIHSIF
ncbi:SH3-domain-containing protein [Coprinellus micaceus]|uniref:SH3-domain-containing protein n=1 Tax=Coprinellus micaceus TaxID=71717 RepID=A0A4Y7TME0_COPMI|nr:SH3-domain-containing protein [Coprinellus micaceus]